MKVGWSGFNVATNLVETALGNEGRLTREDREACWEKVCEAREAIRYRREELWELNYDRLKGDQL